MFRSKNRDGDAYGIERTVFTFSFPFLQGFPVL